MTASPDSMLRDAGSAADRADRSVTTGRARLPLHLQHLKRHHRASRLKVRTLVRADSAEMSGNAEMEDAETSGTDARGEDRDVRARKVSRKTMNSRRAYLSAAALAAVLLIGCSRPSSYEQFIRNSSRDIYGNYAFDVDMTDSLSRYDISLIATFSCIDRDFARFTSMPMDLMWESPDGRVFENWIAAGRKEMVDSSYYDKALMVKAGTGLVPAVHGGWKLYVKVPEDSLKLYGMTGMGIRVTRINK